MIEQRQRHFAAWALERWSVKPPTAEEMAQNDVEIEPEGASEESDS